LNLNLHLNFP